MTAPWVKPHLRRRLEEAAGQKNEAQPSPDEGHGQGFSRDASGNLIYKDPDTLVMGSTIYRIVTRTPKKERLADWEAQRAREREEAEEEPQVAKLRALGWIPYIPGQLPPTRRVEVQFNNGSWRPEVWEDNLAYLFARLGSAVKAYRYV